MMNHFFLPFRGVFCRVSPIAFDGTISFLELVNKLQYYVNELADNLNTLETALEEFEAYVETALEGKQDVLTWDETPTAGSDNPVYSKGIKAYVDTGLALKQDVLTWDETPTANSNNPVYSKGIKTYVDNGLSGKEDTLTWDEVPTAGSSNPVYSKGIKAYVDNGLAGKQNVLTFDTAPTENSTNPVESNGIYNALADKAPAHAIVTLTLNNGVWSGDIPYASINAYLQQGRIIIARTTDNEVYLYCSGKSSSGLNEIIFFGVKGNMTVDALNTWTPSWN